MFHVIRRAGRSSEYMGAQRFLMFSDKAAPSRSNCVDTEEASIRGAPCRLAGICNELGLNPPAVGFGSH